MTLEKSLRTFLGAAYDPAETIAATDEEAVDKAELNTDDRCGQDILPIFEDAYWPKSFSLVVRLNPVPFQGDQAQTPATFTSNENACAATLFYARDHQEGHFLNSCYAGIDLVHVAMGGELQDDLFQLKFLEAKPNVIYHKAFPVQRAPSVICSQRHMGAGQWSITTHRQQPLQVNELPIFAYGGIYQPNLPLESIVPIYATLTGSQDHKTLVSLKSQKFWHDKGVFETQSMQLGDTLYTFHDPISKEESLSLGAAIHGGYVKVCLESEDDRKIYQSRSHQSLQGLIEITFISTN